MREWLKRMGLGIAGAVLASVTAMAAAAKAQPAGAPHQVFACALGSKSVSVTASGDQLTYTFGTPARTELRIVGSASRRNLFFRADRYAGPEQQLRFVAGIGPGRHQKRQADSGHALLPPRRTGHRL